MMKAMGVDPSTTKTGIIVLSGSAKDQPEMVHEELFKTKAKWTPFEKQYHTTSAILRVAQAHKPDMIVIENYGFNLRRPGAIIPLVEIGGVIRYHLAQTEFPYISPKPSEMKKFSTDAGNTKKPDMVRIALERYGYDVSEYPKAGQDDMADAFFLALIGLAFKNCLGGLTLKQREVLGQLSVY